MTEAKETVGEGSQRKEFEQWLRMYSPREGVERYTNVWGNDTYRSQRVDDMWTAWQYSSSRAEKAAVMPGYAVVPIEPTEEMITGGNIFLCCPVDNTTSVDIYRAMLAAAPPQSAITEPPANHTKENHALEALAALPKLPDISDVQEVLEFKRRCPWFIERHYETIRAALSASGVSE